MEPNNLDDFIRGKYSEAAWLTEGEDEKERIWKAVHHQIRKNPLSNIMRIAALMLFFLMPAIFLYIQNRRQAELISELKHEITLVDSVFLTSEIHRKQSAVLPEIVYDTILITQPSGEKVTVDTILELHYLTDTVYIDRQTNMEEEIVSDQKELLTRGEIPENIAFEKTEFLLTDDVPAKPEKADKTTSLRIRIGNASDKRQTRSSM